MSEASSIEDLIREISTSGLKGNRSEFDIGAQINVLKNGWDAVDRWVIRIKSLSTLVFSHFFQQLSFMTYIHNWTDYCHDEGQKRGTPPYFMQDVMGILRRWFRRWSSNETCFRVDWIIPAWASIIKVNIRVPLYIFIYLFLFHYFTQWKEVHHLLMIKSKLSPFLLFISFQKPILPKNSAQCEDLNLSQVAIKFSESLTKDTLFVVMVRHITYFV